MDRQRFIELVRQALRDVPPPFRERLGDVDIVVKRRPTAEDLRQAGLPSDDSMYGFYRGIPLTERDSGYNLVAPDVIDIYQEPLEQDFEDDETLVAEIRATVLHELGHYFGIDDDRLDELGLG
jgi:predicted Zn-dependent protease with MMP-like domain